MDRGVIDLPWGIPIAAIAHVWLDPRAPGGWGRATWPADPIRHLHVAPLDLHVGHVLEITSLGGHRWYAWIADADACRFVLAPSPDASTAATSAAHAIEL
ncbi:MAG: hypothetical protein AB7Q27_10380, partial [Acidimicrobiia bacterium]